MLWFWLTLLAVVLLIVVYDLVQTKHAILRNFPVIGHFRYLFEAIGPELRQYIVTSNNEERPFSRDERRWVYTSAKKANNYFGFGTDMDLEQSANHIIVKQATFPLPFPVPGLPGHDHKHELPGAKIIGGPRGRKHAFRPASAVNISGMSFGSLSGAAVEAMNRGAALCGCLHNTGEGGIAPHHGHGGELVYQIGTGYFGARNPDGSFSLDRLLETVSKYPVRAIEVKISQGAKPGLGGVLPSAKITPEISAIRGIPMGRDCISPNHHTAFSDVDSMLDFVEMLAEATGLPVGIKSAVGQLDFWNDLALRMGSGERGVDFIAIDGGEGGTGAAPLVFSDHVAHPFKVGMARVYRAFAERDVHERINFVGSGKLGFPEQALLAFALGCDTISVAREPMLAVGCIQAQRCHTGHCPTGVATQSKWLMRGLDPTSKAARLANYITALRGELLKLSTACGVAHPALITGDHLDILDDQLSADSFWQLFGYERNWGQPSAADCEAIRQIMANPISQSAGIPA